MQPTLLQHRCQRGLTRLPVVLPNAMFTSLTLLTYVHPRVNALWIPLKESDRSVARSASSALTHLPHEIG